MSYDWMVKAESDLDAETRALREIAERVFAEAAAEDELFGFDNRGDELPPELRRRVDRLKFLREAKAALEAEAEAAENAPREEMRAEGLEPRLPRTGAIRSSRGRGRSATSPTPSRRSRRPATGPCTSAPTRKPSSMTARR